jgi:cell division transport system permease protein
MLKDKLSEEKIEALKKTISEFEGVKQIEFKSKAEAAKEFKEFIGNDFEDFLKENPIPASIEINLKGEYFNPDSLRLFSSQLEKDKAVEEVAYERSLMEILNRNLEKVAMAFMVLVSLLMFISFVLINNTVRLNVYSKRFSIYTMKLVGARKSFIRGPFLIKAFFQGILSGLLAALALIGILYLLRDSFAQMFSIFQMELVGAVLVGVVLLGAFICWICTFFVVGRMISFTNNDLYY